MNTKQNRTLNLKDDNNTNYYTKKSKTKSLKQQNNINYNKPKKVNNDNKRNKKQ